MRQILVIADPPGQTQHTIRRAVKLARRLGARLEIVGFVYEHIGNLPGELSDNQLEKLRRKLVHNHRLDVRDAVKKAVGENNLKTTVTVHWEKRVSDWVIARQKEKTYDAIMKGAHRSESALYTPTDWQLMRGCNTPVLLFAEKRWKRGTHVMAAVDLGTKTRSKSRLNLEVVRHARMMADALRCELHVGYAIPFSPVLRDLDVIDKAEVRLQGKQKADQFRASLARHDIAIDGMHVATGAPEKVLVSMAAKNNARLVVLGCVGRKRLAGRVIGNTAEKILRLLKADILAIAP
ncbi:MAG: universal stress protein [Gammaproteobacteria bacterium]|nr:universal stress protein [Gammaproteobacteria bacterium]